jgi:hypothetical protein
MDGVRVGKRFWFVGGRFPVIFTPSCFSDILLDEDAALKHFCYLILCESVFLGKHDPVDLADSTCAPAIDTV